VPAPTFSRLVLELRTVVSLLLRTLVRVDIPLSTAMPGRLFLMMTALDGSLYVVERLFLITVADGSL